VRACGEHWQLHTARPPSGGKFSARLGIAHCLPEPAGIQGQHRLDASHPRAKLPLAGVPGELPGGDAVGPGGLIVAEVEREVPQQAGQPTSRHIEPAPRASVCRPPSTSTARRRYQRSSSSTSLVGWSDRPAPCAPRPGLSAQGSPGRGRRLRSGGLARPTPPSHRPASARPFRPRTCRRSPPARPLAAPAASRTDRGGAAQPLAPIHLIVPCPEQLRVVEQQPQALLVQPAWPLLAPLPLRHHARIDADPDGGALPGDQRDLLGYLLLGQPKPVAMPLQPEVGDVGSSRPHGRLRLFGGGLQPDHFVDHQRDLLVLPCRWSPGRASTSAAKEASQ
jgi:hypothetical protein